MRVRVFVCVRECVRECVWVYVSVGVCVCQTKLPISQAMMHCDVKWGLYEERRDNSSLFPKVLF